MTKLSIFSAIPKKLETITVIAAAPIALIIDEGYVYKSANTIFDCGAVSGYPTQVVDYKQIPPEFIQITNTNENYTYSITISEAA
jgi:hypothetical protein